MFRYISTRPADYPLLNKSIATIGGAIEQTHVGGIHDSLKLVLGRAFRAVFIIFFIT